MSCFDGITDTLFGQKTNPSQTGLSALPTYAQGAYQNLVSGAQTASNTTTPFAPVPFNATQQGALDFLGRGVTTPDQPLMSMATADYGNATGALGNVGGYLNNASQNITAGTNPITGDELNTNIGYFMNPYTGQVVNNAMTDINREAADQQSDIASQASNAGAFGGTRQAVDESELGRNVLNAAGNVSGNLYQTGFQNASNDALSMLQNERQNFLTGAGLNLNQAGTAINQANSYTNNANGEVAGKQALTNIQQQEANAAMGAGNTQNQQQVQQNQIPLQQLQYLASILKTLPNTQQGQITYPGGLLQSQNGISNLGAVGNAGSSGLSSLAAMF